MKVIKVMLRKATKVHVYVQCFSLFVQAWEDLLKLTSIALYVWLFIVYIATHEALGALLTTVTMTTDLQSTVVDKPER